MSLIKIMETSARAQWRCVGEMRAEECFAYIYVDGIPSELINHYVICSVYLNYRLIGRYIAKVVKCKNNGCLSIEGLPEWLCNKTLKVVIARPQKRYWWFP